MEKIKVLMLNYEFPPLGGGAGNATFYLLKEFSAYNDIEIDLITSAVGGYREVVFSNNASIHYLDIGKSSLNLHYQSLTDLINYTFRAYLYSRRLLKRKHYDFCHSFFGIPCGYISMKLKIPYIVSLRGSDVPFYNKRFYWLDRLLLKRMSKSIWRNAERVIANSQGLKELALSSFPGQEIEVINNGIDLETFSPRRRNNLLQGEILKLVSVGRLIERKGYKYLIEALRGLSGVELTIIGGGILKEELEKMANEYSVNVHFLGEINHDLISGYLRQADVFVLPSLNEGMSNAILEAMACGLPVITTDTGGSSELIQENGVIVGKGNTADLRNAILRFLDQPQEIILMGYKSYQIATGMAWGKVAGRYYDIYKSVV